MASIVPGDFTTANLVTVFHKLGMVGSDYPESTDPRVIDAVVVFLKQYTDKIVIVESSGKGFPTPTAFMATGLDRLAKVRGVELMVLEMQPVDRYLLPKAKVMREIVVPQIFSEVARHEARARMRASRQMPGRAGA